MFFLTTFSLNALKAFIFIYPDHGFIFYRTISDSGGLQGFFLSLEKKSNFILGKVFLFNLVCRIWSPDEGKNHICRKLKRKINEQNKFLLVWVWYLKILTRKKSNCVYEKLKEMININSGRSININNIQTQNNTANFNTRPVSEVASDGRPNLNLLRRQKLDICVFCQNIFCFSHNNSNFTKNWLEPKSVRSTL